MAVVVKRATLEADAQLSDAMSALSELDHGYPGLVIEVTLARLAVQYPAYAAAAAIVRAELLTVAAACLDEGVMLV